MKNDQDLDTSSEKLSLARDTPSRCHCGRESLPRSAWVRRLRSPALYVIHTGLNI